MNRKNEEKRNSWVNRVRWIMHIFLNDRKLGFSSINAYFASLLGRRGYKKILVGTHHKVLTVYLGRVFRAFSMLTNRSISRGESFELDYGCDVIVDLHSAFDLSKVGDDWAGLHVSRHPKDLIVSATHYHQKSNEAWLDVKKEKFKGKSYRESINDLETFEEKLIFEMNHSSGDNIDAMLHWRQNVSGFMEIKYEDVLGDSFEELIERICEHLTETPTEYKLLKGLFRYFSINGAGSKNLKHVRNPKSGQWKKQFTKRALIEFNKRFPNAEKELGY